MKTPLSSPLEDALREALKASGWLRFDQYMALSLGHPQGGYYSRLGAPMGESGDFITAPEMGPWLAGCVARAFQGLQSVSQEPLSILELGAGTGQLALDTLLALPLPPVQYAILETSPSLALLQRQRLEAGLASAGRPDLTSRLVWVDRLPEAETHRGLLVANEVADALPVRLFEWQPSGVLEWGLMGDDEGMPRVWTSRPADAELAQEVERRRVALADEGLAWLPGHRGEFCPALRGWAEALGRSLAWGEVLLLDYGYERWELDHPDRHGGTLAGHYRHRRLDDWSDLVAHPGHVDLTAHVDFTDLAQAMRTAGLTDQTLQTQAAWMLDHGVLEQAQSLFREGAGAPPSDPAALRQLGMLQRLLSDSEMGQAFLVLSSRRASLASQTA